MAKSIPLPWVLEKTKDHGAAYRIMDEQEVTVALFYQNPCDDKGTALANARLVLRALKEYSKKHPSLLWT